EAGRPRTDYCHFLARTKLRQLRLDPALGPSAFDDVLLDVLDRDRGLINPQHSSRFARRRTNASGELGEVVRRVKLAQRFLPAPAVHEVVPVGNEVVHRTSRVAERHAAIHAARALRTQLVLGEILVDLEPVVHALRDWTPRGRFPIEFFKPSGLTHAAPPPVLATE